VRRQAEYASRFQLLIRSEADLPEGIASAHAAGRRSVLKSLAGVIENGVAQGGVRPVQARVAALGVLGIMNWVAWWYKPGGREDLDMICTELAELAVSGLTNGAERAPVEGPLDAIKLIRGDLDRLESMLGT
ncbi:hypothetical protein ACFQ07_29390, partial [Actinomadura adrarensis]